MLLLLLFDWILWFHHYLLIQRMSMPTHCDSIMYASAYNSIGNNFTTSDYAIIAEKKQMPRKMLEKFENEA